MDFYRTEARSGAERVENLEELGQKRPGLVTGGLWQDAVSLPWTNWRNLAHLARRRTPRRRIMSPLAAFLTRGPGAGDNQAQARQDAVQLMTIHSAKGLGLMPSS